jgi:hypothetical protein
MEFHGTTRELRTFRRLVKVNTPSRRARRRYEGSAAFFVGMVARGGASARIHGASMRRSSLYDAEFPCVFLPDAVFPSPDLDAFCTRRWSDVFPFPVVCLRSSMRQRRSHAFRSIVEHEMTHANQALCGRFPDLGASATAAAAASTVFGMATAEFEAYFLQLGRWPGLLPADRRSVRADFSLFTWSFARAWVATMEQLLDGAFCEPDLLDAVLDIVQARLASFLVELGALRFDADWFDRDQPRLVATIAEARGPSPHHAAALAWSERRPGWTRW